NSEVGSALCRRVVTAAPLAYRRSRSLSPLGVLKTTWNLLSPRLSTARIRREGLGTLGSGVPSPASGDLFPFLMDRFTSPFLHAANSRFQTFRRVCRVRSRA